MNILYIAYSCSPYEGSEDKIGWCVPYESAKTNQVYVITKAEQRPAVMRFLSENPCENLHFYFVDIPPVYKKLFRGFLYSGRLNIWHRRVLPLAREICKEKEIHVIHQITPIEFRAIGHYGDIPGVKFVCGPIGGGEYIPKGLRGYALSQCHIELIRVFANSMARVKLKVDKRLDQCHWMLYANRETRLFLEKVTSGVENCPLFFDNGLNSNELCDHIPAEDKKGKKAVFLCVGRQIYRKGYAFLLDALKLLPEEMDYVCRIIGDGPELEKLRKICLQDRKLSEHVVFVGKVPHESIAQEYMHADAFIMPSLRETTGTVLLEAMANSLPVITANRFGGATLLDEETGWLVEGADAASWKKALADAIAMCIENPEEVSRRGRNARIKAEEYTWEEKNKYYQALYRELIQ